MVNQADLNLDNFSKTNILFEELLGLTTKTINQLPMTNNSNIFYSIGIVSTIRPQWPVRVRAVSIFKKQPQILDTMPSEA